MDSSSTSTTAVSALRNPRARPNAPPSSSQPFMQPFTYLPSPRQDVQQGASWTMQSMQSWSLSCLPAPASQGNHAPVAGHAPLPPMNPYGDASIMMCPPYAGVPMPPIPWQVSPPQSMPTNPRHHSQLHSAPPQRYMSHSDPTESTPSFAGSAGLHFDTSFGLSFSPLLPQCPLLPPTELTSRLPPTQAFSNPNQARSSAVVGSPNTTRQASLTGQSLRQRPNDSVPLRRPNHGVSQGLSSHNSPRPTPPSARNRQGGHRGQRNLAEPARSRSHMPDRKSVV